MADDQPMNEVPPSSANAQAVDATHGNTLAAQVAGQQVISAHHQGVHVSSPVYPGFPEGAIPVVAPYNPMGAPMTQSYAPRGIPRPLGLLPMNMWRSLRFENHNFLVAMRDHFQNVGRIRADWFTRATAMWQVGASNTPHRLLAKIQEVVRNFFKFVNRVREIREQELERIMTFLEMLERATADDFATDHRVVLPERLMSQLPTRVRDIQQVMQNVDVDILFESVDW